MSDVGSIKLQFSKTLLSNPSLSIYTWLPNENDANFKDVYKNLIEKDNVLFLGYNSYGVKFDLSGAEADKIFDILDGKIARDKGIEYIDSHSTGYKKYSSDDFIAEYDNYAEKYDSKENGVIGDSESAVDFVKSIKKGTVITEGVLITAKATYKYKVDVNTVSKGSNNVPVPSVGATGLIKPKEGFLVYTNIRGSEPESDLSIVSSMDSMFSIELSDDEKQLVIYREMAWANDRSKNTPYAIISKDFKDSLIKLSKELFQDIVNWHAEDYVKVRSTDPYKSFFEDNTSEINKMFSKNGMNLELQSDRNGERVFSISKRRSDETIMRFDIENLGKMTIGVKISYIGKKTVDIGYEKANLVDAKDFVDTFAVIVKKYNGVKRAGVISTNSDDQGAAVAINAKDKPAETKIKVAGDSASLLRAFVNRNLEAINSDHEISTFFIDTPKEYEKFGVSIPAICLVVTDGRASIGSLKREELVRTFDKSKTLKRYADWKRGTIVGYDGPVWYSIYVSAKEARDKGISSINEEYYGFIGIGGHVFCVEGCNEDEDARLSSMEEIEKNYSEYRVDEDGDIWVK